MLISFLHFSRGRALNLVSLNWNGCHTKIELRNKERNENRDVHDMRPFREQQYIPPHTHSKDKTNDEGIQCSRDFL